jgi:hypothetical protein
MYKITYNAGDNKSKDIVSEYEVFLNDAKETILYRQTLVEALGYSSNLLNRGLTLKVLDKTNKRKCFYRIKKL